MYLDKRTTQSIIDQGKARGLKGEDVLNGLIERGYEPEGIDVGTARVAIAQSKEQKSANPLEEAMGDVKDVGRDINNAAQTRGAKLNEIDAAEKSGQQGPLRSLFQKFGQGAGFAGDVIGSAFKGAAKALLPENAERAAGDQFTKVVETIGGSELAQEGMALYQELQQRDPAAARDLESALNIAFLAADVATAGLASRTAAALGKGAVKAAGEAVASTGRVAGRAGALPGFAASEIQGTLTGTSGETIRQAFAAARAGGDELKAFTENLRKNVTPEQLVNKMREATDIIQAQKSQRFGQMLETIGDETVNASDILPSVVEDLKKVGVIVDDKGQLDFSGSKFRTVPAAQSKLQAMYDEVAGLGSSQTIRNIDTSRQALKALLLSGDDASANTANMVITGAIDRVRGAGKQVKGYGEALEQFAEDAEFLDEVMRSLGSGDKATIDTAYRKLATALKTNNEQRKALLEELDQATGGYILSSVAGQQLSEELPRGLFRQIAAGIAGAGIATGSVGTGIVPALLFASPRAAGEVLRALGIGARKVDEMLKALTGVKAQLNLTDDAI